MFLLFEEFFRTGEGAEARKVWAQVQFSKNGAQGRRCNAQNLEARPPLLFTNFDLYSFQ